MGWVTGSRGWEWGWAGRAQHRYMTHPTGAGTAARAGGPSAAERAYRHLKGAILEQVYPGGLLVSEGEIAAATGAAGRVWPRRAELRADLTRRLDEMRRAHAAGDVTALMAADRAFHATVVGAAGNEILAEQYHRLRDRQIRMGGAGFRLSPGWAEVVLTEHAAQLDALDGDGPQLFLDAVAAHIDNAAAELRTLR